MKRLAVLFVAATLLSSCGGGGGGSGGGGGGGGGSPLPLTTSVSAITPPTVVYSVSGTYQDSGGARGVTGTMTTSSYPTSIVNFAIYDSNSQTVASMNVGGTLSNTTTRTYGRRFDVLNLFSEGARRLGDGTDVYWEAALGASPVSFSIGDSWDLDATVTPDLLGRDAANGSVRLFLTQFRWSVNDVASIQVPLGWYTCYVVDVYEEYYDYLTGITFGTSARIFVRPEVGAIYMEQTAAALNGSNSAVMTITVEAVSVH
jgi:hypothetical protein